MMSLQGVFLLAIYISTSSAAVYNKTFDGVEEIDSAFSFPGTLNSTASGTTSTVVVNASQEVIDALDINVSDGTLNLGFKSGTSIDVTGATYNITVPAGSIDEVDKTGSGRLGVDGSVADSDDSFSLSNAGSGGLYVYNVTVDEVDIEQSGAGTVVLAGTPSKVEVDVSGSAATYIIGVSDSVEVELSGSGKVYVDSQGNNVAISGMASGSATVSYTGGRCSISGFGNACNSVNSFTLPR